MSRRLLLLMVAVLLASAGLLWQRYSHSIRTPAPPPIPVSTVEPIAPATTSPSATQPDLVLDLFEPTPEQLDRQQAERLLRQRIEEALTITFALTRCGLIDQAEYATTYNALVAYVLASDLAADATTADAELRRIAESAGARYALIYSRVPCSTPSLLTARDQLREWRDQSAASTATSSRP